MRRAVVSLVLVLTLWAALPAHLALAQDPPPDPSAESDRGTDDLDVERFSRPREADSSPGRAAGLPLAIAAVAIMGVTVVVVLRARGARRARSGQTTDGQFADGSGGQ